MKFTRFIITLVLCVTFLASVTVGAAEYGEFAFTPEQGAEMVSYVALKKPDRVYGSLRDLTLMGIFREERGFSLANCVTNTDALKIIFRAAGLESYAYALGEDLELRKTLGVNPERPFSTADGFFIAAYQKGLINRYRLDGYFADKPGFRATDYCVRQDALVWIAKTFGISPSYDYTYLSRLDGMSLMNPNSTPYIAGILNSGISVSVNGGITPCKIITMSEFITLLTRFSPYLLSANSIEQHEGYISSVTEKKGTLCVTLDNGDSFIASPGNSALFLGANYFDNLFVLADKSYTNKKVTYYTKDGALLFVTSNAAKPDYTYVSELPCTLYFYDDLTGALVVKTKDEKYKELFLEDKCDIFCGDVPYSADDLMYFTDKKIDVALCGYGKYSMQKAVKISIENEAKK